MLCRLNSTVGVSEPCPEERCAFWEDGGAVVGGRCAFERIDLQGRTELASLLLSIRTRLEESRDSSLEP